MDAYGQKCRTKHEIRIAITAHPAQHVAELSWETLEGLGREEDAGSRGSLPGSLRGDPSRFS